MIKEVKNCRTQTISVLARDEADTLSRFAGLFARRGFDIESLSVGKGREKGMTRLTVLVRGDDWQIDQCQKQISKLLGVAQVSSIDPKNKVEREIALIKIKSDEKMREEIFQMLEVFRGRVVDASQTGLVVELTGPATKIDAFIELFPGDVILDVARTGSVAVSRWAGAAAE